METLKELNRKVSADGRLSVEEINEMRKHLMVEGGGMTLEKGNFLFDFKDKVNPKHIEDVDAFEALFVDAISDLLLADQDSPGEIDEEEAKWVRGRIQAKGFRDRFDHRLLDNLKERSINYPTILNFKGRWTRRFEVALYGTRFLTLLAAFGSLLAAVALFAKGSVIVVKGLIDFFRNFASPHYENLLETFVSSVDIFLFAMVLIIFGVGIYELFISKIDPVERKVANRPTWLQINSIDDLKSSLGKVILMVLIVTFFKHSIEVSYANVNDLLKLGVGVILISGALYITHKSH